MNNTKPFSQHLYNQFDHPAKNLISNYLQSVGWDVSDEETFGPDLVATKGNRKCYHEVEIKLGWKGEWPENWRTIQIPARKARLLHGVKKLTFWVISNDKTQAWAMSSKVVVGSIQTIVKNYYVEDGELFFQIPIEKAILVRFGGK